MVDWTDPVTIEKAAKASITVSAALVKMKALFKRKRRLTDADLLKMLTLTVVALDANNESVKHLFNVKDILSKYVEAKQAEAESIVSMLTTHEELMSGMHADIE